MDLFAVSQDEYEEAGSLYNRSLAIREKALDPDHPDVATSLSNLALFLRAQVRAARNSGKFLRCPIGFEVLNNSAGC